MPNDEGIEPELREACFICGAKGRFYTMGAQSGNFVLTGNDVQFRHDGFVGRKKELADLASFVSSGLLVAVIGQRSTGKTSLVSRLIKQQNFTEWEWIHGGERNVGNQIDDFVLRLNKREGRFPLVIVDDCEFLSEFELKLLIGRLYSPRIVDSTILLSAKELDIGRRLFHYPLRPWYEVLTSEPKTTDLVFGISETVSDIEIVSSQIILIGDQLIDRLKRYPNDVYKLPSRKFEELVAELLTNQGCKVELTQQTHDGGKDIIATATTPIGKVLTLVETKRHRRDRLISVGMVRQLYGVLNDHAASHAMFVTTSGFTRNATLFQKRHEYELSLKEFQDIKEWIYNYKR